MPASSALRSSNWPKLAIIPALLLLLGTIAWHVQQLRARRAAEPQQQPAATPLPAAAAPDLTVLAQWEPYGAANQNTAPTQAAPVVASALNIQLRGTLAPSGGAKGSAIIADESGSEKAYRVGDLISADATLAEVKPHEIVIKHAEQLESVVLPKTPSQGGGEAAALPEATNLPQPAAPARPPKTPAKPTPPAAAAAAAMAPGAPAAPAPATSAMTPAIPAAPAPPPETLPPGDN
jgi:type II secretory pathway component PulC